MHWNVLPKTYKEMHVGLNRQPRIFINTVGVNCIIRSDRIWTPQLQFAKFNSLAPGRCGCNFKLVIFKLIPKIVMFRISCEIALRWIPEDLVNGKSTLVQIMAWCLQATNHYLNQWWLRSVRSYGITGPQWVKQTKQRITRQCRFAVVWFG